ncbi:hypothetical protein Pla52o_49630 [Novipirellula galeiformis]|uniref:Uncharacterized protein n=1 Tax=Novipirellula galeiformis TaxID=2528004 RepID=A0A5C6C0S3_9BACT|nr:hypothetical protein Pla52o_49630 [Novipirellula galeiformis]
MSGVLSMTRRVVINNFKTQAGVHHADAAVIDVSQVAKVIFRSSLW